MNTAKIPGWILTVLVVLFCFWIFGAVLNVGFGLVGLGMLILLGKLWSISLISYRRRITSVMLERRHCPSCGHGLAGCENAEGTHARCSECGSVWRTDRVGMARDARVAPAVISAGLFDEPER